MAEPLTKNDTPNLETGRAAQVITKEQGEQTIYRGGEVEHRILFVDFDDRNGETPRLHVNIDGREHTLSKRRTVKDRGSRVTVRAQCFAISYDHDF